MASVDTGGGGEGGKTKQKKANLRVDFTPMVDMNMLLITFFMLATTLSKPQTMNINYPSKDEVKDDKGNKVRQSTAITLLLGANDVVYYYEGMPAEDGSSYDDPEFLQEITYGAGGLTDYLIGRNRGTYEQIQELKKQRNDLEITEEAYREQSKEIQERAMKELKIAPTVIIKPTDLSTYKNMVAALDEMLVANIGTYAILDVTEGDRRLLWNKTKNADYLTEEERAEASAAAQ